MVRTQPRLCYGEYVEVVVLSEVQIIIETSAIAYNPVPVKFLIRSMSVLLYVIMLRRKVQQSDSKHAHIVSILYYRKPRIKKHVKFIIYDTRHSVYFYISCSYNLPSNR